MPAEIYRCYLKYKGEEAGEGEVSWVYFEIAYMYKEFLCKLEVELS